VINRHINHEVPTAGAALITRGARVLKTIIRTTEMIARRNGVVTALTVIRDDMQIAGTGCYV
jgi:hypothetical protein